MNSKVLIVVVLAGVAVCAITSYFLYKVFQPWGIGWVGVALSVVFFLFVLGGIFRAMMTRK